jgi:hypothetical protein
LTLAKIGGSLLRHRDELARRQAAELGVVPSHEGLETGDGPVLEPHDRLEQDLELLSLQGAPQVRLERHPIGAVAAH